METLEGRRLLVTGPMPVDVPDQNYVPDQNFANPEDADGNGVVAPLDVLLVINRLNNDQPSGTPNPYLTDIDGDGVMSPRDALLVINRLNSDSDTSSVPPEQRAIGLRKSLDAGVLPLNMTLADAKELLQTLENGGHYETGERYRNGQMLNINDPPKDLAGAATAAEGTTPTAAQSSNNTTSEDLVPEMTSLESAEEKDPLALLDSADETLSEPLSDPTLVGATSEATDSTNADRMSAQLAEQLGERLATADASEQVAQAIVDGVKNGSTGEDIIREVEGLPAPVGDANSQIAQLFADIDFLAMLEQLGIDIGALSQAILGENTRTGSPQPEAILAQFSSHDYLFSSAEDLP